MSFIQYSCETSKIQTGTYRPGELQGTRTNKEKYFKKWSDHPKRTHSTRVLRPAALHLLITLRLRKRGHDTQRRKCVSGFFLHPASMKLWKAPHPSQRFAKPFWCGQRLLWVGRKVGRLWMGRELQVLISFDLARPTPRLTARVQTIGGHSSEGCCWVTQQARPPGASSCCHGFHPSNFTFRSRVCHWECLFFF